MQFIQNLLSLFEISAIRIINFYIITYLRGCLYGDEPVGLAIVRGLNFTALLDGNFLAFLAGLNLARMRYRRASPYECVYMKNLKPSQARSRIVNGEISLRRADPPLM